MSLNFEVTVENQQFLQGLERAQSAMKQTASAIENEGVKIDDVFSKIQMAANTAFAGYTLKQVVTTLASVRGKYQQYQMAFETMLGSAEQANQKMAEFAKLAAITPFGMDDVVNGAKQLLAYGIETEKVTDTMRRLGDVAAGLGLNLNDLAWLYGTTAVQGRLFTQDFRQFTGRGIPLADELAKQFGVTKDKVQELVTAGKVGFPEVEKAIKSMTDEGGKFGGLMENQSKSLTGKWSNIEDTIEQAINQLGKQTEGLMDKGLDAITVMVENWQSIGEAVMSAASAIGLYKAVMAGVSIFNKNITDYSIGQEASALQGVLNAKSQAHLGDLLAKEGAGTLSDVESAELVALKQQAANADLQEAVASKQLTAAKAAQIAAMREEAAEYAALLQAKAESAAADLADKTQDVVNAESLVEKRKEEYSIAYEVNQEAQNALIYAERNKQAMDERVNAAQEYFDLVNDSDNGFSASDQEAAADELAAAMKSQKAAATEVATAAENADNAAQQLNTAETNLNTASTELNAASERKAAAATTAEATAKEANTVAQQVNTESTTADTIAKKLHVQWTKLCTTVQNAWNASILASPIFWIAASIAGVTFAIVKMATALESAEAAQNSLNNIMDEANSKLEERKNKISEYINTIKSSDSTSLDKQLAFDNLKSLAPELTTVYNSVKKLEEADLSEFSKQVGELANQENEKQLRDRIDTLRSLVSQYHDLQEGSLEARSTWSNDLIDKFKDAGVEGSGWWLGDLSKWGDAAQGTLTLLEEELQKITQAKEAIAVPTQIDVKLAESDYITTKEQLDYMSDFVVAMEKSEVKMPFDPNIKDEADSIISEVQGKIDMLKKEQRENPIQFTTEKEQALNEYRALLNNMKEWKKQAAQGGVFDIPLYFTYNITQKQNQADKKKQYYNYVTQRYEEAHEEAKSYSQAFKEAEKEYKAAQKALQSAKNGTVEEYEKAQDRLKTAKSAFSDLGGDTTGKINKKAASDAKKQADERLKVQKELDKELKQLRQKNTDDEIAQMEEGTQKKIAEIKNSYNKQRKSIEDLEATFREKNKKAGLKTNADGLTTAQEESLATANANLDKKETREIQKVYKDISANYQAEVQKREAIEKKYDDDIVSMQKHRKELEEQLSKETTEAKKRELQTQIEDAITSEAEANKQKFSELAQYDFDLLKKNPDYTKAFEDLKMVSTETLNNLIHLFEEAKEKAGENLKPDQLREYTSTLQQMYDELLGRQDPFKQFAAAYASQRSAQAEVSALEKKVKAYKESNGEIKNATAVEKSLTDAYDTREKAEKALAKAKDKLIKADAQYLKSLKNLNEKVKSLADAISNLGDTIGGTEGEILSLIGSVLTFVTNTSEGIKVVAQTGAQAISTIEKASVILTIISAAIQLIQKLSSLYKDSHAQYEEYDEKIQKVNKLTESVNDYQLAVLKARQEEDSWFGTTSLMDLQDSYEASNKALESYLQTAAEAQAIYQNESGGGWLTNAVKWIGNAVSDLVSLPGKLISKGLSAIGLDMDGWLGTVVQWSTDALFGGVEAVIGKGIGELINATDLYKEGTTAAINNLRIETKSASKGFLGSGIGGHSQKTQDLTEWAREKYGAELFDENYLVNVELANQILDDYGDKLVGNTKETLERLVELREEYDKWVEEVEDYVSEMYSPLADNLTDALFDWLDTGEDVMDSFKDYASDTFVEIAKEMVKTMIYTDLFDEYKERLSELYKMYSMEGITLNKLSKSVTSLTGNFMQQAEALEPTYEAFLTGLEEGFQKIGIDLTGSDSDAEGSSGTWSSLGEETGKSIDGRLTATQIQVTRIADMLSTNILTSLAQIQSLTSSFDESNEAIQDIRTMMVMSNSYLEDIASYNKSMYKEWGTKIEDIRVKLQTL